MSEIVLSRVNKHYGTAHHAVKDVDLTIADKEFVVLVGPSGCGKSTTLRMIAGLEDITSGEIRIGDRVVNDLPPRDRDIAMVFQNYALYLHMTVYDNLAFGLRNKKVPEADIRQSIDRVAEILGLGELMQRRPRQLSGGQQQRVALGRCIVRNPQAFLFDEPLSNLDAKLRTQMRLELKRLRTQVPTTSVFVTHDQVEAMTLGDRVVVMRDGSIQQCGTPLEVYTMPANKFVAGFIGAPAMNFVEVEIRAEDGCLVAHGPGLRLRVPERSQQALAPWVGRHVIMGIRPEHVSIRPSDEPAGAGHVEVIEQLGSEIVLQVRLDALSLTVSRVDPQGHLQVGDDVSLTIVSDQLSFFHPETEWLIQ